MMGGTITIRSIKGIGSEFTVDVPLGVTEEEVLRRRKKAVHNFTALKTLVVDDDVAVCESAVVTLTEMGVIAEWVDSGRKALKRVRNRWGGRTALRYDPHRLEDAGNGRYRDCPAYPGDCRAGGHHHHYDSIRLGLH